VLIPANVPPKDQPAFEAAVVEFLFGTDRPRPELRTELAARGVSLNALAAVSKPRLGLCPDPDAYEFVPSRSLAKHAAASGFSFTGGGSVDVLFQYGHAEKNSSDVLYVNLKLPREIAQNISDEHTGDIATALFGDCELPRGAQAYLDAHGVGLEEVAHKADAKFRGGSVPTTTRVSPENARLLKDAGFNTDQFGKLQIKSVSALS
jgi:hypothetical protein